MGRRVFTKEAPQLAPRDTVCTYHLVYNRDVPESFTREPLMNLLNVVIHTTPRNLVLGHHVSNENSIDSLGEIMKLVALATV